MNNQYIPGVCNIGPAEIARRKQFGWFFLGVTILLWASLFIYRAPQPWRWLLFFPAMFSASGFLQAALHFCAGFGSRGLFNFGDEVGRTDTVEQAEYRRKDQEKARQIGWYAALIGFAVALFSYMSI